LDDDEIPPAAVKPKPTRTNKTAEAVFSLDAEDFFEAEEIEESLPDLEMIDDAEEIITLGEDAIVIEEEIAPTIPSKPTAPTSSQSPHGSVPQSAAITPSPEKPRSDTAAKPSRSGITPSLPVQPLADSTIPTGATSKESTTRRAKRVKVKRPEVKITLVMPGDKSPFAK